MSKYAPERTVLWDFDGTIAPFTWPNPPSDPFPGVVEALRLLKKKNFQILIFTARAWQGWDEVVHVGYRAEQLKQVEDYLKEWGIPYDGITNEKMPALAIIDDRAIRVSKYTNWMGLAKELIEEAKNGEYGHHRTTPKEPTIPRNSGGTGEATRQKAGGLRVKGGPIR